MPFRLALIDLPHRFGPPGDRLGVLDQALGAVGGGVDLALFPARAFTGVVALDRATDLRAFAEPLGGPTVEAAKRAAKRWRSAVGVPLVERTGRGAYESYVVVDSDGRLLAQVRRATLDATTEWATPGAPAAATFKRGDVRCAVSLEPTESALKDALGKGLSRLDLVAWPTAWRGADAERRTRVTALAAGAGVFVANVNWGRGEPAVEGQGTPFVADPRGAAVDAIRAADLTELVLLDVTWTGRHASR